MANNPPSLGHSQNASASSKLLIESSSSLSNIACPNRTYSSIDANFGSSSQFTNNADLSSGLDDSMAAATSAADYIRRSPTPTSMSPNYDEDPFITSPTLISASLNSLLRNNYLADQNKDAHGDSLSACGSTPNSISTMNSYFSNVSLYNSNNNHNDSTDTRKTTQPYSSNSGHSGSCPHQHPHPTLSASIEPSLDDILADKLTSPYNLASFMGYMSQQHCLETLEFILDTQKYRNYYISAEYSKTHLKRIWKRIIDTYVNFNSPKELNLPSDIKDILLKQTDTTLENEDANPPSPDDFGPAYKVVKMMIKENPYLGFICSFKTTCTCYNDTRPFTYIVPTLALNLTSSLATSSKSSTCRKSSDYYQEFATCIKSRISNVPCSASRSSISNENETKKTTLKRLQFDSPEASYSDGASSTENLSLLVSIPVNSNTTQNSFSSAPIGNKRSIVLKNNSRFSFSSPLNVPAL
ncbi:regulator of G protein signaling superfamily, partial [Nadsonia fulvescens var. elongata DSM 6958]